MSKSDAAFQADEACLAELLWAGDKQAYAIPLYQRRYVWNISQNQQLWEDVLTCYRNKTNHFLGSLVLMAYHQDEYSEKGQADTLVTNAYNVKHVVDGQQRLTSLSLALAALYWNMRSQEQIYKNLPDLDDYDSDDWDKLKVTIQSYLVSDVKDQRSKSGKGKIPRLIPVKSVYEAYKSIVNKEGHGRQLLIDKAFLFYRDKIAELREEMLPDNKRQPARDYYEFYSQMCDALTRFVKFVRIICRDGEDPFQVFESLNGTGLSLTSADRIKNVLMGKGSRECPSIPISTVESKWAYIEGCVGGSKEIEAFISSYLFTITNDRVPRKDLCDVFVKKYLSEFASIPKALDDLCKAADLYGTIAHQLPYADEDDIERKLNANTVELLVNILRNNRQQSVVPLLAIAKRYGFDSEFNLIAETLLNLLVRFKVCQRSANSLDKVFASFCENIDKKSAAELSDLLKNNMPPDLAFREEFESLTFDGGKPADLARARYYLAAIENYLRNQNGQDNLTTQEEYTLEHIIPQTFDQADWFANYPEEIAFFNDDDGQHFENFRDYTINSIGNMCLLRRPENSAAGKKNFGNKLKSYELPDSDGKTAVGTFQLVKQIKANDMRVKINDPSAESIVIIKEDGTFDAQSVAVRASAMAEMAVMIW